MLQGSHSCLIDLYRAFSSRSKFRGNCCECGKRVMGDTATGAPTQAPHGVKRRAEDDPRDEQRLTKRFDLLNLGMIREERNKLDVLLNNMPFRS